MGRPIKRRKLPKQASEVEQLTSDEVLEAVFGKEAQKALKEQANPTETDPKQDTPNSHSTI